MGKKSRPKDTSTTRPEEVVEDPPPEPDYPRYRAEPGAPISLSEIDPDDTGGYKRKKM